MSWLLFMDESGHDHKNMPMEVRGGVALHASQVWNFVRGWNDAVVAAFGPDFVQLRGEIKGCKLLGRERFTWRSQMPHLNDVERHKGVNRFLTNKLQKIAPKRTDFTAYGQASLQMAHAILDLLEKYGARVFASAIPRGERMPKDYAFSHFLRKDHVFLQERFYYFLEAEKAHGLFVMDQTERQNDKRYVQRLHDYYEKTQEGRKRSHWIIPSPLFVDSDLSVGVQAADLCLYIVNWGFRRPEWAFKGQIRQDIHDEFAGRVGKLQFSGSGFRDSMTFKTHGIVYVPDPYSARE